MQQNSHRKRFGRRHCTRNGEVITPEMWDGVMVGLLIFNLYMFDIRN